MQESIGEDKNLWGSEAQRELLVRFCRTVPVSEKFFLTGGSALGVFYLHHRVSNDVDLFTTEEIDLMKYSTLLRDVVRPTQVISERSPTFLSYISAEGVKVDFAVDHLSLKGARPRIELEKGVFLTLDRLNNIAANKICSVVSRAEPRDVVDLFFLLKERPLIADFVKLFKEARRREALLEDGLYVSSAFEEIAEATDAIIEELKESLRKPVDAQEFRKFWLALANTVEREFLPSPP